MHAGNLGFLGSGFAGSTAEHVDRRQLIPQPYLSKELSMYFHLILKNLPSYFVTTMHFILREEIMTDLQLVSTGRT